jgi:hypothetical protein
MATSLLADHCVVFFIVRQNLLDLNLNSWPQFKAVGVAIRCFDTEYKPPFPLTNHCVVLFDGERGFEITRALSRATKNIFFVGESS